MNYEYEDYRNKEPYDPPKWMDWVPTFLNYLRMIPGRNGVPLKYVCRQDDAPDATPQPDFLDEYVNNAPLAGNAYAIDNRQVYIFLTNLINLLRAMYVKVDIRIRLFINQKIGKNSFP